MNQGLGNAGYSTKQKKYSEDSIFKAAREFAKQYANWGPDELGVEIYRLERLACRTMA